MRELFQKKKLKKLKKLDQKTKDDIQFSFDRVRIAEAQLKIGQDLVELSDGLFAGQKLATNTAGCCILEVVMRISPAA